MPGGRRGSALELVHDVEESPDGYGYTYTMISSDPGNDQTGKVRLDPLGPNRTRFSFEERYNLTKAPWKWFEGPIYKFINKNNEDSMRRASQWLSRPPRVPRRPHRLARTTDAPAVWADLDRGIPRRARPRVGSGPVCVPRVA